MIHRVILLLLILLPVSASGADSLEALLEQVHKQQGQEQRKNTERLKRFTDARDQQKALLAEARTLLADEQAAGSRLDREAGENISRIRDAGLALETELGDMDELREQLLRSAEWFLKATETSLVSAQIPDRATGVKDLVRTRELPSLEQIEGLWRLQLQEMIEMGRVARFPADIINKDGEPVQANVTRVGLFGAVSDGSFLRYLPGSGRLIEPRRQPPARYRDQALKLEQADSGFVPMPIDPTRGDLLLQLSQTPDLEERIRQGIDQGGVIGWIILGLGGIGLLIAGRRLWVLGRLEGGIRRQLKNKTPDRLNPLGRILQVYTDNPRVDTETLGLKLDEAILRELPRIRWGLGTLSVLAAIAPLLGLLGTVTGIIETFQAVTVHGTGDPRMMSGGISQALVTTVEGLVVAIPLLLLHSFLSSRSNRIIQVLDEQSAAMVARLAEQQSAPQPALPGASAHG